MAAGRCDAEVLLVGLLALLVLVLGLFGVTLRGVVAHRLAATDDLLTRQGRALATAQDLRAALSQADAAAAAEVFAPVELLVDREAPAAQQRQRYDTVKSDVSFETSVAASARGVLDLRRLDPKLCPQDVGDRLVAGAVDPGADLGQSTDGGGPPGAGPGPGGQSGGLEPPWSDAPPAPPHPAGPGTVTSDGSVAGSAGSAGSVGSAGSGASGGAGSSGRAIVGEGTAVGGSAAAGPTSCPLDLLAQEIPVYNGMVERARANNRAGLSIGEANLRAASTMMRAEILPATEILVARYAAAVDRGYQDATGSRGEWAVVLTAAVALGVLVGVQVLLVRRTNRLVNPGLLVATGAVLAAVTWTAVAFGSQQSRLDTARDVSYRPMTLLARSKALALEARVDENLSLAALGNGLRFDEHFAWVARGLGFDPSGDRLPPEPVTRRGSLVVALDAPAGAGLPADLEENLRAWLRIHESVVRLLASSPDSVVAAARGPGDTGPTAGDPRSSDAFGAAVTRTLGPGTAAFTRLLDSLDTAVDTARGRFDTEVHRASAQLRGLRLAGPALVLAAIIAAVAGLWPRLREFL